VRGGIPFRFWRPGAIYNRVVGESVDADKFHKIVKDVQSTEDEIGKLERELELVKSGKKSTTELLRLSTSGFFLKLGTTGVGQFRSSAVDAAKDFRLGIAQRKADRLDIKNIKKEIKKNKKQLPGMIRRQEKTVEKVTELRERTREIFDRTFGAEISRLSKLRPQMKESEYVDKLRKLKAKVHNYAKERNMPHMEEFLKDALGGQEIPQTELEKKRDLASVAKWWNEITGQPIGTSQTEELLTSLNAPEHRAVLDNILAGKANSNEVSELLKFFFKGEYKSVKLEEERRIKNPSPAKLMQILKAAPEYLKSKYALERVFSDFKEYFFPDSAENFDDYFERILSEKIDRTKKPAEERKTKEEAKKFAGPFWQAVCGKEPTESEAIALLKLTKGRFPDHYLQILENPPYRDVCNFFFSGIYRRKSIMADVTRRAIPVADNVFNSLVVANKFANVDPANIQFVFRAFTFDEKYEKLDLGDLTPDLFSEILRKKDDLDYAKYKTHLYLPGRIRKI
jgi:hypothetical protein